MSSDYRTLEIFYDTLNGRFESDSDITFQDQGELILSYLKECGGEKRMTEVKEDIEVYAIMFKWYPVNDRFEVSSNFTNGKDLENILEFYFYEITSPFSLAVAY